MSSRVLPMSHCRQKMMGGCVNNKDEAELLLWCYGAVILSLINKNGYSSVQPSGKVSKR